MTGNLEQRFLNKLDKSAKDLISFLTAPYINSLNNYSAREIIENGWIPLRIDSRVEINKIHKTSQKSVYILGDNMTPAAQASWDKHLANLIAKGKVEGQHYIVVRGYNAFVVWLKDTLSKDHGIYAVINGRNQGTFSEEITHGWVLHIENDDHRPLEEKLHDWEQLGIPEPSITLWSGGKSPHFHYQLDTPPEGLPIERIYTLKEQITRQGGFDGFDSKNGLNIFKVQTYRMPGGMHLKSGNRSEIVSQRDGKYKIEYLEKHFFASPLGAYNGTDKALVYEYPLGVQPWELIISPTWRDRFFPYETPAEQQAKKESRKGFDYRPATTKVDKKPGITSEQITQKLANNLKDTKFRIGDLLYPENKQRIAAGSPDGSGRWKQAYAIAANIWEINDLLTAHGIIPQDSPEELFETWVKKSYDSNDIKQKEVWKTFQAEQKKAQYSEAQLAFFEQVLNKVAEKAVAQDLMQDLNSQRTAEHLIEASDRNHLIKEKIADLSFNHIPVLYNPKTKNWREIVENTRASRIIPVTSSLTHAQKIVQENNGYCILINSETPAVLVHKLNMMLVQGEYQLAFTIDAPDEDKAMAELIRSGRFSDGIAKSAKDVFKPACVVVGNEGRIWGAGYYWAYSQEQVASLVSSGSLAGYVGESKYFNDVLSQAAKAKAASLLAFLAEMGTGKTESFGTIVKNWDGKLQLSVSHRELLAMQAAERLGLVFYKGDADSAKAKYDLAKRKGLAITIDTLVQALNNLGYMSAFDKKDWMNVTLLLDEIESLVKYLVESSTLNKNRQEAIACLKELVQTIALNGGRIIISDANLRLSTIQLFEKWVAEAFHDNWEPNSNKKYSCFTVVNTFKKLQNRKLTVIDSASASVSELNRRLVEESQRIFHFTDIKNASKRNFFSTQTLGMYSREVAGYGHVLDADTRCWQDDQDHNLLDKLMDVVRSTNEKSLLISISPVVDSGTNWKNLGLNAVWFNYSGVMGISNTLQQLERVRDDVPRIGWIKPRTTPTMSLKDILNLDKRHRETVASYLQAKDKLSETWAKYQLKEDEQIQEELALLFPKMDRALTEWWQKSLLENYHGCQEFRLNLVARMQEKGYVLDNANFEVNTVLIDELKDFGQQAKEKMLKEVSESDPDLETDPNADTMPKRHAQANDLKSCLHAMGLLNEQWKAHFDSAKQLELVKRSLGKQSKHKRKLIFGFAIQSYLLSANEDVSEIVQCTEDLRNAVMSSKRSIKDIPLAIQPLVEFMKLQLKIKELVTKASAEAAKKSMCEDKQFRLYIHNQMPYIKAANKILMANKDMIRKYFAFDVSLNPNNAANNVKKVMVAIGYDFKAIKLRDAEAGKDKNGGNRNCNGFILWEDTLQHEIWQCWVDQARANRPDFYKGYYNPSNEESGDYLWQALHGIQDPAIIKSWAMDALGITPSKEISALPARHRQLELALV